MGFARYSTETRLGLYQALSPCAGDKALRMSVLVSSEPVCGGAVQEDRERLQLKAEREECKDKIVNKEMVLMRWDDRYCKSH